MKNQTRLSIFILCISCLTSTFAFQKNQQTVSSNPVPPKAKKINKELRIHNDVRIDEYYWMRNRDADNVVAHMNAENEYYYSITGHTKDFQEKLFQEMKGRIKEDNTSVPYKTNGYWYQTKYAIGKEYPIYIRKKETLEAPEELLFNCNEEAEGHAYFAMRGLRVSPDNRMLAFAVDTVSRRQYVLGFKDLTTGRILEDKIENTSGTAVWANDNKTVFYVKKDPVTLRTDRIFKHTLGTPVSEDKEIYNEKDETYNLGLYRTKSKKYIVIGSNSTTTSEYRVLPTDDPDGDFKIVQPRTRGLEYGVDHLGSYFYIVTNEGDATNFKVVRTAEDKTEKENWEVIVPHRKDVLVEDITLYTDYLIVTERSNGLNRFWIQPWENKEDGYYLPLEGETYDCYASINPDPDSEIFRYGYSSLTTPWSTYDYNLMDKTQELKKQQEVLGGAFDPNNYVSERIWATARDGVKVPISLIYRKGLQKDGSHPVLQYGYGSYGVTSDPTFSSVRLSLLDRGFIFAITHIRGGEYMGRPWYDDGKMLKKKNTFTDFIDAGKYLINQKYTSPQHMYVYGGSAGGLLMGAVANMAPDQYNGIIAAVPFVDVVTTMLDEDIPLTTGEYDEWGNPNEKKYYEYMKSYSPYDNVTAQAYPHMLILTGYHDSQVQYWEPAKWVARLRDRKTDTRPVLFHINMDAGHGGASGRFEALKEVAEEYTFLLDLENKIDKLN